jgi:ubiquinone/menaquinone biosynthesis C-methylase UbiE
MAVERIIPGTNAWHESHATHAERYRHACLQAKDKSVLDAACGVGYGSHMLALAGAASVTGIDVSADTIALAHKHFSHPKLEFQQADCLSLPFADQSFDLVVSLETIEHLPDPPRFLNEISRVLRPGGELVLSCPNSLTHSRSPLFVEENPFHCNEMTMEELRILVEARFEVEGWHHQSPSLAQLVARHVEQLNLCLERSLLVRVENVVRKLLRKQPLGAMRTQPGLERAGHVTPQPVSPITDLTGPWSEEAHVFIVNAVVKG